MKQQMSNVLAKDDKIAFFSNIRDFMSQMRNGAGTEDGKQILVENGSGDRNGEALTMGELVDIAMRITMKMRATKGVAYDATTSVAR